LEPSYGGGDNGIFPGSPPVDSEPPLEPAPGKETGIQGCDGDDDEYDGKAAEMWQGTEGSCTKERGSGATTPINPEADILLGHEVFNAGINNLLGDADVGAETGCSTARTVMPVPGQRPHPPEDTVASRGGDQNAQLQMILHMTTQQPLELQQPQPLPVPDFRERRDHYRSVESMWFPAALLDAQVGIDNAASPGGRRGGGGTPTVMSRSVSAFNLATGNIFMHPLIRANMSIIVFTVVHLAVWGLVLIYIALESLHAGRNGRSYKKWVRCAFTNFDKSQPKAWEAICGSHAKYRASFNLAVVTLMAVTLYGALITAMHFSTIARQVLASSLKDRYFLAKKQLSKILPEWAKRCCLRYFRVNLNSDAGTNQNERAHQQLEFLFTSQQSLQDAAAFMLAPFRGNRKKQQRG
jgi:hypothetical protein